MLDDDGTTREATRGPTRPAESRKSATASATRAALVREESTRSRTGLHLLALGAAVSGVLLQLVVHRQPVHWVITGLLAVLAASSFVLALWTRGDRIVPPAASLSIGVAITVTALLAVTYLGVLSSTALVLVPLLFAYANSNWAAEAWAVLIACVAGYLVISLLSFAGVFPLTGSVLALQKENTRALGGLTVLAEMVFGVSFWFSYRNRQTMLRAITDVANFRLEAERRGALLAEAREDLRQAVDAGRLGRLSGRTLDAYRVGEVIGRGAMGEVYAATELASGHPVAIKVLHPHLVDNAEDVGRFFRELEITSAIDSPHVVRVLGKGTAPDGSPYLAMEWLVGSDLATLLRVEGPLSLRDTQKLVRDVAEALGAARAAGIVHRDVKPQNLFRCDTDTGPTWKVLDFGVSRFVDVTSSLTQGAIGTPNYMAPEQCQGLPVDHRADVFALGVVIYRALTGQPAFAAADHYSVVVRIVNEQPVRPSELAMLPADVDLVLALALAKAREERFQTVEELAEALSAAAHNGLPEATRVRARELLARAPWGLSSAAEGEDFSREMTAPVR